MKDYIVERTSNAERRPEEQSQKTECDQENLWNEIQLKGHIDRNKHKKRRKKKRKKKEWASSAGLCQI